MTIITAGLIALGLSFAPSTAPELAPPAKIERVQQLKFKWAGSWIWSYENSKWVDAKNRSSIELVDGDKIQYCYNDACKKVKYSQKDGLYSFALKWKKDSKTASYFEFWLGDKGALEGRFWMDQTTRSQRAPDAMVRMASGG